MPALVEHFRLISGCCWISADRSSKFTKLGKGAPIGGDVLAGSRKKVVWFRAGDSVGGTPTDAVGTTALPEKSLRIGERAARLAHEGPVERVSAASPRPSRRGERRGKDPKDQKDQNGNQSDHRNLILHKGVEESLISSTPSDLGLGSYVCILVKLSL